MVHAICRASERVTTLDMLHGLMLLGLLVAQVYGQLASPQPVHPLPLAAHHPDLPVQFIVELLVNGQFDRMGSFLFGLSFYRCWHLTSLAGSGLDGLDADRIARRLLIGLLGIGLLLSFLLRSADLLFKYALLGFTLLYFRNQSVSNLLTWMVGLALLAILVPSSLGLLHATVVRHQSGSESLIDLLMSFFRSGLFGELPGWQPVGEWLLPGRSVSQGFSAYVSYELMMLGGLLVGKLGILHRDPRLRVRLSLLQVLVLPAAFLLKGAWAILALGLVALPESVVAYQPVLLALSGFLGSSLLTGVYLLDIGVNARLTPSGWAGWIGRVGQISVTNYVLQSILCPLLCGCMLAVAGQLTFWGRTGILVGIYTIQIGFSRVWGAYCRLGPLEWVCRRWIYDKLGQPNTVTTTKR